MNNLGFIPSWQFNYNAGPDDPSLRGLSLDPTSAPVVGGTIDTLNTVFDSWWWKNRKLVVIGGGVALGLGIIGGIAAILK